MEANETTPSLSRSFRDCIRLFRNFLLALHDENCRVVQLRQVDVTEISDQCGRAKIWGDQMKADLPERARGSLDDTLRHDNDLKGLVEAIFMRLSGLLPTSIAEKKYDPILGSDHDSISSVSADDSDSDSGSGSGSGSDSEADGQPRRNRMPKIHLLVQQITDQIRSLYDLSSLLRRPRITDKYIRSVNSKSHTTASDTLPLMVSFSKLDESHIIEKVLQWRGLTKSGQSLSCEDETPAQERHSLATDDVDDILWYCQRLARANTRRREQLQHWADHPYVATQDKLPSTQPLPVLIKPSLKGSGTKEESGSQASTLKPTSFKFPQAGPKSTMSKQSFSTAAVSDVHDTKTNARPRTVYAPTSVGQGRSNSVPDPPKTQDGKTTFTCPYCGITLESSEMQNRQSWKRHVFRDLRPYVCTFEHCQNPDKLYVSRHEWIYHELQIHRRKYVCKDCPKTYSSRTEMSAHVQEHYGESISPAQLGVILDLCDQQDDGMNGEKDECLVCGEELSFQALQRHLATHMEDMALFVLPNTQEGQDMGGTNDSVQAEQLRSRGKSGDSESETSSLGFSAAGDHGQTSADFSKLLTSEEAGYGSKFTHWNVTDDPEVASLKVLVQQLEDQDDGVRDAAVEALGSHPALPYEIIEAMGAKLGCQDGEGRTVLSWAAEKVRKVTLERLIEKGADFESRDANGWSPLHYATSNGNEAMVRVLLEVGADFECRNEDGWSPLHFATNNGNEAIVRLLLEVGADVNSVDNLRWSPLHFAANNSNENIVIMLLDMGADDQIKDFEGDTPLSLAAECGHEAVVQLLREYADSPVSQQSLETDHSPPHNAMDVTDGNFLAEIDFNSLPSLYKKVGEGWNAVFNPKLQRDLDVDLVHVFKHSSVVASVKFSHDGMYIATGCNFTARIFDIQTGEQVCVLGHNAPKEGEDMYIRSVSFSPDDKCLATAAENKIIYLWDIKVGTILAQFEGHEMDIYSVDFAPDGRSILSGAGDRTVRLWDVDTGANTLTVSAEDSAISVAFSSDMQLIAAGLGDKSVTIWETSTGVRLTRLEGPEGHSDAVYSVAFSPDGETLVSASLDKTIKVWQLDMPVRTRSKFEAKCIKTLRGHKDFVVSVAVTPDGYGLISGSKDNSLQFWDPKTGKAQFMLQCHRNTIVSVATSPKGGMFATGSGDMEARVWSYV
ncbi:hypothetical protein BHE90_006511 [Fusarium euwallaceae]|uniref:C2H2-type domain-containing protein n=1 Tax=Fusarium euwallaceae TaxID=1147111 RepID=A0A430LTH0_9HYPO|nr:hypothetical protein BHE90_006511 [Fusarium euwallaceae]